MKLPCVLIIECGSVMVKAFESLSDDGRKFTTVAGLSTNLAELFFEISHLTPDLIVLCESQPLTSLESVGNLMMTYPSLRVIIVSEDSNVLKVLSKQDIPMVTSSDLLNIIGAL